MTLHDLPALNACLNATSAVCLVTGWRLIRSGRREAHKRAMIAAASVSLVFLVSYLTYHFQVGSVPFRGIGTIRTVYLTILFTHTLLAVVVAVMAPMTLWRGLKNRLDQHRRIARWTLPIWGYVSVTGVIVYLMLYQM